MLNRNILLFLAVIAAVSARAATLQSEGSVLGLAERNGAVEYVRGADGVARVVAAEEAFTLQLRDSKGEPTRLKSSDFAFANDGGFLTWRYTGGPRSVAAADGRVQGAGQVRDAGVRP